ncbi:MAG: hypothetical protein AB8F95_13695 [Bacteroidia bacterium]
MKYCITILMLLTTVSTYGQLNEELKVKIMSIDTTDEYCNYYMFDSTFSQKDRLVSISYLWVPKSDTFTIQKLQVGKRYHVLVDHVIPDNPSDSIILRGHMSTGTYYVDGERRRSGKEFEAKHAIKRLDYYRFKKFLK